MNGTTKAVAIAAGVVAIGLSAVALVGREDCYQVTGLTMDGGVREYVQVELCAKAGEKPSVSGMDVVRMDPIAEVTQKGVMKAGQAGGFACACSTGADCEQWVHAIPEAKRDAGWIAARPGVTFEKNKWRGSGCFPMQCMNLGGAEIWPKECPGSKKTKQTPRGP